MFRIRKVPTQILGNVRSPILNKIVCRSAGAAWRGNRYIEEKQTELETENK